MIGAAPELIQHASARRIEREALAAFLPPERVSVADWAAQRRWLANEGGGYVGRWKHEEAPYLTEPMECLTRLDEFDTVAIVGPGQCGKTEIPQNWLLTAVPNDPADMLWYMQTDDGIEAFVKNRINTMIDAHDDLARHLGRRPVDDSLHYKKFDGMTLELLSATHSNLINKKAGRIVADEVDAYARDLGDVKALLDVRRQTYFQSMLLAMSHPDLAGGLDADRDWTAGIMAFYRDSTRATWWWPCPHCGGWSSPNPNAPRVMTLAWSDVPDLDTLAASAHLVCPLNGCAIEEPQRRAMVQAGCWVHLGQMIDEAGAITGIVTARKTAGFWIVGAMSLLIRGGIGALARARVKAEREHAAGAAEGESTLRTVMVKGWGVPYQPPKPIGSVDAATLIERAKAEIYPLGVVPDGVRFLTAWIDVQVAHFELLVLGFGVDGESWVVDKQRIPADTATDRRAWDGLVGDLAEKAYPLAGSSGRGMRLRAIGYDSGGVPGVSDQAYSLWRRLRAKNITRCLGQGEGRDVWTIIPTKGVGELRAVRLSVVYPERARKDRKVTQTGTVALALFNANLFKDDVAGHLLVKEPGPGFIHLPAALLSPEPPHTNFEQLVAETRDLQGRWTRPHQGVRNEMWDLVVGCKVLARLHGLARINWTKPPAWAMPWDGNSLVVGTAPVANAVRGTEATGAAGGADQPRAARAPAAASPPPAASSPKKGGGWKLLP